MKVCIPAANDAGLTSEPYGHFGSAPYYVMHNMATDITEVLRNVNQQHEHGACQPLAAFDGQTVDAMIVGGMGAGAMMKLNAAGVRVFRAGPGTIADNVTAFREATLPEVTPESGCRQHGGCSH